MAMLVNAMFYGQEATSPRVGIVVLGLFRLSWFTLWTSVVGSLIIIPPTAVMALIFKKVKRRSAENSEWATVFNMKIETREEELLDESDPSNKKKKPFMLPFPCVFIGWFLVAVCIGVSAFFIVMYSLQWGQDKSLQWLSGMVIHIIQDIILIQTIKVFLFSLFSSTLLNLPDDGLGVGKLIHAEDVDCKRRTELFRKFRNTIGKIFHHILYVITFALVVGTTMNPYSFFQVQTLKPLVNLNNLAQITDTITDQRTIFDWFQNKLLPNFLNGNQLIYGGVFKGGKLYTVPNHEVVLLGPIRIRQQRVSQTPCQVQNAIVPGYVAKYIPCLTSTSTTCQRLYSDVLGIGDSSERRYFNSNWNLAALLSLQTGVQLNNISTDQAPWINRDAGGPPFAGWQASYGTTGYYVDLPTQLPKAVALIANLRQHRWLDNATSVLFVDFVLYNAEINLFVAVKIVFESLDAGGMSYHTRIYPLNLYQYSDSNAMLIFAVQIVWIVVLFTHLFKIIRQIVKKGFREFRSNGWNLLDLCQCLLCIGIVGLFAARVYAIINTVSRFQIDRSSFVNLDTLANWEDVMFNLYGIAFFMVMLLFFRLLSFNKYWAIFLGTLSVGRNDLLAFAFSFTVITFMFAGLGYETMGMSYREFRSFPESILTLVQNIIGVNGTLMTLSFASRYILVFVMAYSMIVMFLAVQIFMTIMAVVYAIVVRDVENLTHFDFELSEYISHELRNLFNPKTKKEKGEGTQTERPVSVVDVLVRLNKAVDSLSGLVSAREARTERFVSAWSQQIERLGSSNKVVRNMGRSASISTSFLVGQPAPLECVRSSYLKRPSKAESSAITDYDDDQLHSLNPADVSDYWDYLRQNPKHP